MPAAETTHRPNARPAAPPTGLVAMAMRAAQTASGEGASGGRMARAMGEGGTRAGAGSGTANAAWPRYLARCAGHGEGGGGRGALGAAGEAAVGTAGPRAMPIASTEGNAWGGVPANVGRGGIGGGVAGGVGGGAAEGSAGAGAFGGGLWGLLRSGASAAGDLLGRGLGALGAPLRALLPALPPVLLPWLSPGPALWLAQRFSEAMQALGGPLRALDPIAAIRAAMALTGEWSVRAMNGAAEMASGGCHTLLHGATALPQLLSQLLGGAVRHVGRFLQPVGHFLRQVWRSQASPASQWIAQQASGVWTLIRQTGAQLWRFIPTLAGPLQAPVSRLLSAGTSVASAGPDWLMRHAESLWQRIRSRTDGVIGTALDAIGALGSLFTAEGRGRFSAGAGGLVRSAVAPVGDLIGRFGRLLTEGPGLLENPGLIATLAREMLPQLGGLGSLLDSGRQWLGARMSDMGTLIQRALLALQGNPITAPLASQWGALGQGAATLVQWGSSAAGRGLQSLRAMLARLRPTVSALAPVGRTAVRLLARLGRGVQRSAMEAADGVRQTAELLASRAWQAIPCCIRDPLAHMLNRLIGQAIFQISQPLGVHGGGVVGRGMGGIFGGVLNVPPGWMRRVLQPLIAAASRGGWRGGILGGVAPNGIAEILRRIAPNPHGPHRSSPHVSDTTPCSRHVMAAMVQRLAEGAAGGVAGHRLAAAGASAVGESAGAGAGGMAEPVGG
ncbi:MAG: hypothetical protein RJA98_536 [Pseudomonadota bacterium]|jgi:hypothetical protein